MYRRFGPEILAILVVAFGSSVVAAQVREPASAGSESIASRKAARGRLEEIVVTARKRPESQQDTPIAITALSRTALEDLGVQNIEEISRYVPSLNLDRAVGAPNIVRTYMRGVGNGDSISSDDPGVGLYVDGVYLARAQGALIGISDVERIEVLRGPQGTLFGKNNIGGAVHVVTARPEIDELSGHGEVRVGNYHRYDTRFVLNLPLVPERAAARFSFATSTADGYVKNKGPGPDLNDDKLLGGRVQLRLFPGDSSELLFSLDHARENRKGLGGKCKVTNTAPALALFTNQIGLAAACADDANRSTYSVAADKSFHEGSNTTSGSSLTWNWTLSEDLSVKSISSWRRVKSYENKDLDGTALDFFSDRAISPGGNDQHQLSQELQVLGNALDDKLRYVAGLYAFLEDASEERYFGIGPSFNFAPFNMPGAVRYQGLKVENRSYAAFLHTTYHVNDRWDLDLGLRRTIERKRVNRTERIERAGIFRNPLTNAVGVVPASGVPVYEFDLSARFGDWSPLARLSYSLSDDALLYASWSRGFKSGGFNGRADRPALTNQIDDEKLTSYELGLKSTWFDDRLRLNAALFWAIYDNVQLTIPTVISGSAVIIVQNAGTATSRGAELELVARPFDALELRSAIGITNARYREFDDPADPAKDDNLVLGTPGYTMNFGAQYTLGLGRRGDLRLQGDWKHVGRMGTNVNDTRSVRRGKAGELDAQITWELSDGRTEIGLWSKNLLNRSYLQNGLDLADAIGVAVLWYNRPRTYGIAVRRSF